ncbi:MAG: FKBP-type peptidyl-prolyl cis-trans isomerase [Bacteroidales bacterium]|nr:FKBP-type peptidyl-prolyl cis-trans isomerase [Bacteroidales bacterium]
MRIKWFSVFLAFLLVFISCKNEKRYKKSKLGFQYKFYFENPKGVKPDEGSIITLKLKYFNHSDSLLFNSDELSAKFRVQTGNAEGGGIMQNALKMMKTGDSASFLIPASDFYLKTKHDSIPNFILPGEMLRFEIKIVDIVSKQQLNKEYKQFMLKKEAEEKRILDDYLSAENIKEKPTAGGIYIIKISKGNGKKAEYGKKVTIQFTGSYINGKIFDSSIDKGKPLTFVLGDEHVIPAWNKAIAGMRVGDKIKLIAPSKTAYGKTGLKDYVPPFTTLIYEIKLLSIK